METIISLSADNILREVYALSAMRTYINSPRREIPLLTPDNRRALMILAGDAFAATVASTAAYVADCRLLSSEAEKGGDDDLMTVTYRLGPSADRYVAPTLRRAVETAVAMRVLAAVFTDDDSDLAEKYGSRATAASENILVILRSTASPDASARLAPFF